MRFVLGGLFIIFGCSLLFYPQIEKIFFDAKQEQLIETFEQLAHMEHTEDPKELSHIEPPLVPTMQTEQTEEQLNLIDGASGIIRIPKINLEMLIFEGADQTSLQNGAGLIESEKEFGVNNVGIAGHRSLAHGKHFNRLGELTANDEIEILTKEGTFEFVIADTFVVDQRQVEVLADKDAPYITLVTCTPIGKKNPTDRLIVQGKLKQ